MRVELFDDHDCEKIEFIRIELRGKNDSPWLEFRSQFLSELNKLLTEIINVGEVKSDDGLEMKIYEKLIGSPAVQGLDPKSLAEIDGILSKSQLTRAKARLRAVESDQIQLKLRLKKFKISMGLMRAMISSREDVDSIIMIKKMDTFIDIIREFEIDKQ